MRSLAACLCLGLLGLGAVVEAAPPVAEKLIFQAGAQAFDTLWDKLTATAEEGELPQKPGVKFGVKRFRDSGLTIICLINLDNETQRQCDFYVENVPNAYTDKNIGGVIEFRGAAAKSIAAKFKLKDLWHLQANPLASGKQIWRAGYAITKADELFLWEFYYDGKEYFAHFSRVWNPDYYVFDMFERGSTKLFDPKTDSFPKKDIVLVPAPSKSPGGSNSKIDDLFLEGMRGSLFGGRKSSAMGGP